jgi:hypothetical protein
VGTFLSRLAGCRPRSGLLGMPPKARHDTNPQYARASMIFKADSFTVYKLNISPLCDGA